MNDKTLMQTHVEALQCERRKYLHTLYAIRALLVGKSPKPSDIAAVLATIDEVIMEGEK